MMLVVEPSIHGTGHSTINTGILRALRAAFPAQPLRFAAEAEHRQEVERLNEAEPVPNCAYQTIAIPPMGTPPLTRAWQLWHLLRRLLAEHDDGGPIYLLLTCSNGPEFHLGEWFARTARYRGRLWCHFLLHGPDAGAFGWRSRNPLVRRLDLVEVIRRPAHPALRLLVLDAATVPPLEALAPGLAARTGVFKLSLLPQEADDAAPPAGPPWRIALPGQATAPKGIHSFIGMANRLTARYPGQFEFHLVGRLAADVADTPLGAVIPHADRPQARRAKASQMPRARYLELLKSMHFVCLPYQGSYYHTGASGVFYDAVNLRLPLLVMSAPHVAESFAQFGDLGHLCADETALENAIAALADGFDAPRYAAQRARLGAMREAFLPAATGAELKRWMALDSPALVRSLAG